MAKEPKAPPCEHGWPHWRFFLTCEEYLQLLARGGGKCERCSGEMAKICIDHDYLIGKHAVRGLLCGRCNSIVGTVERYERDGDELTYRYLDAEPFHMTISEREMAERRKRVSPVYLPRPRKDAQLLHATRQEVLSLDQAAEVLGKTRDEVSAMQACGRLIGGSGPGPFRAVVVQRLATDERRRGTRLVADVHHAQPLEQDRLDPDGQIPDLVSLAEAASILGITVVAAHKRAMGGKLPGALVGKSLVFRRVVVEAIAEQDARREAERQGSITQQPEPPEAR